MARFTIPAGRFPFPRTPIRTRAGIVWFVDQAAEVDDEDLAAALREVPPVFGIAEDDPPDPDDHDEPDDDPDGEPERPSTRAPKAAWVAYAEQAHDIPAGEAEAMTKAELIEKFGG